MPDKKDQYLTCKMRRGTYTSKSSGGVLLEPKGVYGVNGRMYGLVTHGWPGRMGWILIAEREAVLIPQSLTPHCLVVDRLIAMHNMIHIFFVIGIFP